jgi:hypothetical protein
VAFRTLVAQEDPDVRRLVGDSPGWRVLYREPPGMRTLANALFAMLAVAMIYIASVPALRAGQHYFATMGGSDEHRALVSFVLGLAVSVFLCVLLVGYALRDRAYARAGEGVVRGEVQGLDVIRSSRFAQYLVDVGDTRIALLPELHAALRVGREVVIERDRRGTVRCVLVRDAA